MSGAGAVPFVDARTGRWLAVGLGLVCALVMSACNSSTTGYGEGSRSRSTLPSVSSQHMLVATLADNGGLLSVQSGDRLMVVLPSSAWVFQRIPDPRIVRQGSRPSFTAAGSCRAGKGCGSATAHFEMGSRGKAVVTATCTRRALCAGHSTSFRLRLDVT